MTAAQNTLYWREWAAALRTMRAASPAPISTSAASEIRHEMHFNALGCDKSHLDFSNQEFDRVLSVFRATSRPSDIRGQIALQGQEQLRLRHKVSELVTRIGAGPEYVEGIVRVMAGDEQEVVYGRKNKKKRPGQARLKTHIFENLDNNDLMKVIIALQLEVRRLTKNGHIRRSPADEFAARGGKITPDEARSVLTKREILNLSYECSTPEADEPF